MTIQDKMLFIDDAFEETTGIQKCPDGEGRYVMYKRNDGCIGALLSHPRTGAHFVLGAIRNRWEQLDYERSFLGYPTSDEWQYAINGKPIGCFTEFQGGLITFSYTHSHIRVYKNGPDNQWYELDSNKPMPTDKCVAIRNTLKHPPLPQIRSHRADRRFICPKCGSSMDLYRDEYVHSIYKCPCCNARGKVDPPLPRPGLLQAVIANRGPAVRVLLDAGANPNITDADGNTLLHIAVKHDYSEIVGDLLSHPAQVGANEKDALLHAALVNGYAATVRQLLDAGANKNTPDISGKIPLHIATEKGHGEIIKCLLEKGADVDSVSKDGTTAIHIAVAKGHSNIVQQLIEAGAEINGTDKQGHSALYLAAAQGCNESVKHLLEAGAKVFVLGGNTSLRAAIASAQDELALQYEQDASWDLTANDSKERAARWLREAAQNGNADSQYRMAGYLMQGRMGFPTDATEAMMRLRFAAVAGHSKAANELEDYETLERIGAQIADRLQEAKTQRKQSAGECATDEKDMREIIGKLEMLLSTSLASVLLNEKIPLDIVDSESGEILIAANERITMALIRKLAKHYNRIDIDPSPIRNRVKEIIASFSQRLADAHSVLDTYRWRTLEQTPAYDALMALKQRAENGDAAAESELGYAYYFGTEFIKKDIQKAKALFSSATKRGHLPSMSALGDCHASQNEDAQAERCYRQAAKKGDAHGQFRVFQLKLESDSTHFLKSAAQQGHAEAQRELADQYADANNGSEDRAEAAHWYRRAAEQGDAQAQSRLGDCYEQGWIVSENPRENIQSYWNKQAAKWYRKSAEQGDVEAQKRLARCYAAGIGVVQSEAQAAKWYGRAGDSGAYEELGDLYAEIGFKNKARKYYRKAGLNGWSDQIRALGAKNTW